MTSPSDAIPATAPTPTFEAAANDFLQKSSEGRDGGLPLDPETLRAYESRIRRWAIPQLGSVPIGELSQDHFETFLAYLVREAPSRATAQKVLTLTKSILNYAVKKRILRSNPAQHVKVAADWSSDEDKKEERTPTLAEMRAIDEAVLAGYTSPKKGTRDAYRKYFAFFLLLRLTGLRFSECIGLQWTDFDEDMTSLSVRRKVGRPQTNKPKEKRIGRNKSKRSRRDIPVPMAAADILNDWRRYCPATNENWVFPTKRGNPMNYHNVRERFWIPTLERAGVRKIGLHSLRHFYASTLLRSGKAHEASKFLGHHSVAFTMDQYGHLLPDDEELLDEIRKTISDSLSM